MRSFCDPGQFKPQHVLSLMLVAIAYITQSSVAILLLMDETVPYHIQQADGTVLSLQFANPSFETTQQREQQLEAQADEAAEFRSTIEPVDLDTEVYAVFSAEIHPRVFPDKQFETLSSDGELIVDTMLDGFHEIEAQQDDAETPFRWYKKPMLPMIVEQVERTQWKQTVPEVGGSLLSNLIIGHALPNANHRASLSFVGTYLQTIEPRFTMPDTGISGEWYGWASEYVAESKRLLTLRRNAAMFAHLRAWGCRAIVRKNENRIEFADYDLAVNDPLSHFGSQHHSRSVAFIRRILCRTVNEHLLNQTDEGKSAFVDRLAAAY